MGILGLLSLKYIVVFVVADVGFLLPMIYHDMPSYVMRYDELPCRSCRFPASPEPSFQPGSFQMFPGVQSSRVHLYLRLGEPRSRDVALQAIEVKGTTFRIRQGKSIMAFCQSDLTSI